METDFGIVVALPIELEAVKQALEEYEEPNIRDAPGCITGKIGNYNVAVIKSSDQGSVCSALAAADLIREFQPTYLVLLGIAAGFPGEVNLGDIVIAESVIAYEYIKLYNGSSKREPRPFRARKVHKYIDPFLQRTKQLYQIPGKPTSEITEIRKGALASGCKLVASGEFRDSLKEINRKFLALEMEAEGIAQAAQNCDMPFFVIKGISDFAAEETKGDRKTDESRFFHDAWQGYAARASVECFKQFLSYCVETHTINPRRNHPIPRMGKLRPLLSTEQEFLRGIREQPSLELGNLDLGCKLFPNSLWENLKDSHIFFDDPERENQILLEWIEEPLPRKTIENLVKELKEVNDNPEKYEYSPEEIDDLRETYRRLTKEGSNAYPRIVRPPQITSDNGNQFLHIPIGPSLYGIALVEEKKINLPSANDLRLNHNLNSLAVRVAALFEKDGDKWIEFHQRNAKSNSTFKGAWDVGAAGYIDPIHHIDPENPDRISPWQACVAELNEELGIPSFDLPYREHFRFFGIGRNNLTGQLDILGDCQLAKAPDPDRPVKEKVSQYSRCVLTPESLANFVLDKEYWVPTALLTMILILRSEGYETSRISAAFSRCTGKIKLEP